jgi:hypothetical protein
MRFTFESGERHDRFIAICSGLTGLSNYEVLRLIEDGTKAGKLGFLSIQGPKGTVEIDADYGALVLRSVGR